MKRKNGITMSMLAVAVVIMLIVLTTVTVVGTKSVDTANFEAYQSKIRRIGDIALEYYTINNQVPTTGEVIIPSSLDGQILTEITNNNDNNNKLYVIDLSKLDIAIDIGKGNLTNLDVFLIAENTNNVYYLKGREYKGVRYYGII